MSASYGVHRVVKHSVRRSQNQEVRIARGSDQARHVKCRVAIVGFALIVAACGDAGDEGERVASIDDTVAVAPGEDEPVDTEQQLMQFAACMRDQGIELPDPTVDAEGNVQIEPPPDFQPADLEGIFDAAETCQQFLEGISLGFDNIDLAAVTDVLLEFATCMRTNGYDLPDPDFSFATSGDAPPSAGPFGDIDLEDPQFLTAFAACQDVIAELGTAQS